MHDNIDAKRLFPSPRALLIAATALISAILVAGCGGGGSSPPVANLSSTTTSTTSSAASTGTATTSESRTATTSTSSSGATLSKGSAGGSLVEWASCMRRHGDPNQPDPAIDAHGGINISIPSTTASLSNAVHNGTAPCNEYLAEASAALRAGARNLTPPNQTALVSYSQCMRATGVPNYPDPGTGETANLNGIDMNSPFFVRANNACGHKIHAPSWWTNGWGPPGNISVSSGPMCGNSVCAPTSGANRPRRGASGANGPTTGG